MADWAKLHSDILGDPKLMRAAREGAQRLDLLPWFLAFAKQANDDGRLTVGGLPAVPADFVPLIPCITEADVAAALAALSDLGVLTMDADHALRFARWQDRQTKPSASREAWKERQRRSRDRRKVSRNQAVTPLSRERVTRDKRDGHTHVTRTCHATEESSTTSETGKTPTEFSRVSPDAGVDLTPSTEPLPPALEARRQEFRKQALALDAETPA